MPSISVIVPAYQAEKLLKDCVESVRKQTYQDWELLLIDDGSRDGTREIGEACAGQDDRVRYFRKENGGVSSARNYGLREARGDYIAFLDADDRFEPQCLETLWSIREQAGADTAGCAHLNLRPDGSTESELLLPEGVYDHQAIQEKIVDPLLGDRLTLPVFNGYIWRYLFSGDIIRDNEIAFEGAYLEDELFLMEYFYHAQKLAVTEQPLYRYFLNPASATHKYMPDLDKVFGRFMERKEELVERFGLESRRPLWRENSNWAGLLIAIGNEYAAGNSKTIREKQKAVEALCRRPDMARAISAVAPKGLSRNKQVVADLVRGGHFTLLTWMYRLKNRT